MMQPVLAIPFAAALLLASSAFAQAPLPTAGGLVEVKPSATPGTAAGQRTMQVSATIYKVDSRSRIVQLENDYGGYETIKVGPAVGSLDRFAPGDRVTVELRQGIALEFQPPGSEFVAPTESSAAAASPAGKGAVASVDGEMRSTVTITRIDPKKRIVTFQGPGGNVYRVKAGPQVKLDRLHVGDKLLATYTETLALKLGKTAPK
jgi:hypothetical protein